MTARDDATVLNTVSIDDLDQAIHDLRDIAADRTLRDDALPTARDVVEALADVDEVYLVAAQRYADDHERAEVLARVRRIVERLPA